MIKISELFYSLQGEGRYQGVPSVFLRTFGCNFKCQGFGMPKGKFSVERENIKAEDYTDYKSLPLVSTGCDSYASWDPRFKHLSPMLSTNDIVGRIMDLLPCNNWVDEHLVITGGEPLLGWQKQYPELLDHTSMQSLKELTFETNGTQQLTDDFIKYLTSWTQQRYPNNNGGELTFSVSPKLSVSGEKWEDSILPHIIVEYQKIGYTYLKFVVESESDEKEIMEAVNTYRKAGFHGPIYLMPVGGVEHVYNINKKNVAELAMRLGFRYSDRLHVALWKNAWGT